MSESTIKRTCSALAEIVIDLLKDNDTLSTRVTHLEELVAHLKAETRHLKAEAASALQESTV
jgi:uncharacterized protein YaaN involved in tellurite resistance